jgi:hypothetical protein
LHPDLAAVVAAWPTLPEAIRAGILTMVRTSSGAPGNSENPANGGGR